MIIIIFFFSPPNELHYLKEQVEHVTSSAKPNHTSTSYVNPQR